MDPFNPSLVEMGSTCYHKNYYKYKYRDHVSDTTHQQMMLDNLYHDKSMYKDDVTMTVFVSEEKKYDFDEWNGKDAWDTYDDDGEVEEKDKKYSFISIYTLKYRSVRKLKSDILVFVDIDKNAYLKIAMPFIKDSMIHDVFFMDHKGELLDLCILEEFMEKIKE